MTAREWWRVVARLLLATQAALAVLAVEPARYGVGEDWRPFLALLSVLLTALVSQLPPALRAPERTPEPPSER